MSQSEEENPYAPPSADPAGAPEVVLDPVEDGSDMELRSTYGAQEASVRTIGLYLYLIAGMGVATMILMLSAPRLVEQMIARAGPQAALPVAAMQLFMAVGGLVGGGLYAFMGFFLRRLQNWARWVVVGVLGYGMLGSFVGLAIVRSMLPVEMIVTAGSLAFHVYVIVVLLLPNNRVVLSERYRRVVSRTPGQSPRPSVRDRVFLGAATAFSLGTLVMQAFRAFG
jgi:hypothetical protein